MRRRSHLVGIALLGCLLLAPAASARRRRKERPKRIRISANFALREAPAPAGDEEWYFRADPLDREPLGDRVPVIMVHGYESAISHLPFDKHSNRHWDRFRSDYRYAEQFPHMKFYIFDFRPFPDVRELAAVLADKIVDEVFSQVPEDREIAFMGISAGALISRYAAADPRIQPRVAHILSLNGANRGSALASLAKANRSFRRKIGRAWWWIMSYQRKKILVSPGAVSLAYDNYDGALSPWAVERYGLIANEPLRVFNETDPNRHKIICYQNIPKSLFGSGRFGLENWVRLKILKKVHPTFRTADPILHDKSGLLAGVEVNKRRVFKGLDHWQLNDMAVVNKVFDDLIEINRSVRARALHREHAE